MKCGFPAVRNGSIVACGNCMPCRINKKRMWTGRLLLEAAHSPTTSSFVTLTYSDEHLPRTELGSTLYVPDAMAFLDRLRHRSGVGECRYFIVGEYGDQTHRPHYHAALFGVPPEGWEDRIRECWKDQGHVSVGEVTQESAGYIAGYCTKKMTARDDERLRPGQVPEFSRMSKFPPLGAQGMRHIAAMMQTHTGSKALAAKGDVPDSFRMFGKTYPVGSYWHKWLRNELGVPGKAPVRPWELDYHAWVKEVEHREKRATALWQENRYDSKAIRRGAKGRTL